MKIAITGSHGFIGSELVRVLTTAGHHVIPFVRGSSPDDHIAWDPAKKFLDRDAFEKAHVDAVVNLAGEGVANKKWTPQQKERILLSRVNGTQLIVDAINNMKNQPSFFVSSSAVGFYGDRGEEKLVETSSSGDDFLSDVCIQWENEAHKATVPTAIIRTGHVLDPSGSMLKKLLLPFKLGVGGIVGDGDQYMSWITRHDHIRAIIHILEHTIAGTFNLSGPEPVTNREFTHLLGHHLHRPTLLPTPLIPLRLRYSSELVETLLLASQRAIPKALLDSGFTFTHASLDQAFDAIL